MTDAQSHGAAETGRSDAEFWTNTGASGKILPVMPLRPLDTFLPWGAGNFNRLRHLLKVEIRHPPIKSRPAIVIDCRPTCPPSDCNPRRSREC